MNPANPPLALDGELTIYRAAELRATLLGALAAGDGDLHIDIGGVTEVDSAGVQLLLAAQKSARARQRTLRLAGHSDALADVLRLLDLDAQLAAPSVDAAPSH